MSVCNTYSGDDNFTTFSAVVYFAGLALGVDVFRMGDALKEELADNVECSCPDSCKIKDNELLQRATFLFFVTTQNAM